MNSLGLMEFRGYVPAIEGLDIALKAANVSLLRCSKDGGGLISVFITGGVGAVNAAVAAVQSGMGSQLLESSVIPRPSAGVAALLESMVKAPTCPPAAQEPQASQAPSAERQAPERADESPAEAEKATLQETVPEEPQQENTAFLPAPVPAQEDTFTEIEEELRREETALEDKLNAMSLKELRKLAVSMKIEGFGPEKIKKAPKQSLIAEIMKEQER